LRRAIDTPVVSGAHVGSAVGAPVGAHVPSGTSANASNSKPTEEEEESDVNTTCRLVALVLRSSGSVSPLKLPNTSPLVPSKTLRKS
jgi:hypothetical protein